MRSNKAGTGAADLDDDGDDDKHAQLAAQRQRKGPMKKKKKPKTMLTFSSFARCAELSRPKSLLLSSSPSPSPSAAFNGKNPSRNDEDIESWSDDDDEYDYEDGDDDDEEEPEDGETVQVDFEFFDPKEGDFHGVKLLLQKYLDTYQWDLSGFVDLILAQTTVGTVVKSADSEGDSEDSDESRDKADEDELFAVITALNLGRYQDNQCIKELKQYLLGVCKEENAKVKLRQALEEDARDVGLLVCQRFANCPYQLVLKLYEALFDEISWATEDEPTAVLRDSFRFKHYVLITKICENKAQPLKGTVKRKADLEDPVIYLKQEDEIFHEVSSWSFKFELSAEEVAPPELKNYRKMGLVMVIKAEVIPKFLEKLKSLVEKL